MSSVTPSIRRPLAKSFRKSRAVFFCSCFHVFMFSCFHVFFVHDRHDLGRDTGVGMGFFQELVDVDAIRFLSLLLEEIPVSGDGFVSRPCR